MAETASAASASWATTAATIPASERHRTVSIDSARKTSSLDSPGRPSSLYSAHKTGRLEPDYRNHKLDSASRAHRRCKLGSASLAARLTFACGVGRTGCLDPARLLAAMKIAFASSLRQALVPLSHWISEC